MGRSVVVLGVFGSLGSYAFQGLFLISLPLSKLYVKSVRLPQNIPDSQGMFRSP